MGSSDGGNRRVVAPQDHRRRDTAKLLSPTSEQPGQAMHRRTLGAIGNSAPPPTGRANGNFARLRRGLWLTLRWRHAGGPVRKCWLREPLPGSHLTFSGDIVPALQAQRTRAAEFMSRPLAERCLRLHVEVW